MTYNKYYIYFFILLIQIVSFSLVNRYPIPYELYYYITKVDQSLLTDPLTYSFQLLKTPSYTFLEFFYDRPVIFFWSSFLIDLILSIILFHLVFSLTKKKIISLLVILIFSPLFLAIFTKIFMDPGFRVIHVFGYGSYILSTRYLLGIVTLLSYFYLIKQRYNLSLFFYSLSLMSHPSSALLSGLFLFSTFFIIRLKIKSYLYFIIASLVGLAPTFFKLFKLKEFNFQADLLSKREWYLRVIHDEPDDFSLLYQLSNNLNEIIFTTLLVIIISFLIYKNNKLDLITKKIIYCSLLLPIFYLFSFASFEYGSVYFDNFSLIDPIIKSQAGYKILKFTYFPIVLAFGLVLKDFMFFEKYSKKIKSFLKIALILLFIVIVPSIYFIEPINFKNKKILLSQLSDVKKNNYIDYLNARFFYYNKRTYAHENYFLNIEEEKLEKIKEETNFFELKKHVKLLNNLPESVDKNSLKYNNVESFNHLISIIDENIPKKSSVIILPYFLYLRDVLPQYNFFYLEKPDANLALGSRLAASIISERLNDLIDVDHKQLHLNFSPFLNSDIRRRYLSINDDKIVHLKNKYPKYKYFLTETGHELNFTKVYYDELYVIYKLY